VPLSLADDIALPLRAPFNPCDNASLAAIGGGAGVRLPAAVVAAAPPPTLGLPASLLAALSAPGGALAGVASIDVRLVQWGVSPFAESSGVSALGYPPPIAGLATRASGRPAGNETAPALGLAASVSALVRRRALARLSGMVSAALSFVGSALSPAVAASLSR
jgi:hypothetical protein